MRRRLLVLVSLTILAAGAACKPRVKAVTELASVKGGTAAPAPDPSATSETLPRSTVREIGIEEAQALALRPAVVVLDVRTPEEFALGHVPRATNLDFNAPDFEERLRALDHGATYLVHCQSGGRSAQARDAMMGDGFTSVLHLADGYAGWEAAGMPVER